MKTSLYWASQKYLCEFWVRSNGVEGRVRVIYDDALEYAVNPAWHVVEIPFEEETR